MLDLVASLHPFACREIALGRIVGVLVVCAKEKREEGMVRNYIYVAVAVVGFALYDRIAAYVTFENYWREERRKQIEQLAENSGQATTTS